MNVSNFDDLPLVLNAELVKKVLGVSKASVYNLFHSEGFPSFCVGKRMLVAKEAFRVWLESQKKES